MLSSSFFSMKKARISKSEAKQQIEEFFSKKKLDKEGIRKIKRLAAHDNIKLKDHRKRFCKKCLNPIAGKIRTSKHYKTIECKFCGFKNRYKIKLF